jgi:hypothetical protein
LPLLPLLVLLLLLLCEKVLAPRPSVPCLLQVLLRLCCCCRETPRLCLIPYRLHRRCRMRHRLRCGREVRRVRPEKAVGDMPSPSRRAASRCVRQWPLAPSGGSARGRRNHASLLPPAP